MSVEVKQTGMKGLLLIQPSVHRDDRGYFAEFYNERKLSAHGIEKLFTQDNVSRSKAGVVRGLHFQRPPYAQCKLVGVLEGRVLDVVVDLRKQSKTFGQVYTIELSADNLTQLLVPEGFAHGFSTLSDTCVFFYKCTKHYHQPSEMGIRWDDPDLAIDWQLEDPEISIRTLICPFGKTLKRPLFINTP